MNVRKNCHFSDPTHPVPLQTVWHNIGMVPNEKIFTQICIYDNTIDVKGQVPWVKILAWKIFLWLHFCQNPPKILGFLWFSLKQNVNFANNVSIWQKQGHGASFWSISYLKGLGLQSFVFGQFYLIKYFFSGLLWSNG